MAEVMMVEWIDQSHMDVCPPELAGSNPKIGDSR